MMTRLYWAKIPYNGKTFESLRARLASSQFSEESGTGFLLTESRRDSISGYFFDTRTVLETIPQISGNSVEREHQVLRRTAFKLCRTFPQLEIQNPSTNSPLTRRLSEALDYELPITAVEIGCLEWIGLLQNSFDEIRVTKAAVRNITIDNESYYNIEVSSRGDALRSLKRVVGDSRFKEVANARCTARIRSNTVEITINPRRISVKGYTSSVVVDAIRKCVRSTGSF